MQQNFETLCHKIGLAVHPSLHFQPKEDTKFPELHNNDYGARLLQVHNFKLDALTLKLLAFLVTHFKITSLKLSRNDMDAEAEELKKFIEK